MTTTDDRHTAIDWEARGRAAKKEQVRADVLRYASNIARTSNTGQILNIATPVMAWIDEATDSTDYNRRCTAVQQVHANHRDNSGLWCYEENPAGSFLSEAVDLYAFLSA